jgi:phage terminase large subunit-like protein
MVRHVIQTARPRTPFKKLTASRGKVVRAEPISSLTEQGKIRFAGNFPALEDELCSFTTNGYAGERSPNRADAFVWAMSELFPGLVKQKTESKRSTEYVAPTGASGWMG